MPAEILVCVLGAATLVVVAVMEAVGFLGIVGALRFRNCRTCARWTLRTIDAQPVCSRCRHGELRALREPARWHLPRLRVHLLHFGH